MGNNAQNNPSHKYVVAGTIVALMLLVSSAMATHYSIKANKKIIKKLESEGY